MGGSASMLVGLGEAVVVKWKLASAAASAALATITLAWEATKTYGASLLGAAASAYEAVKSAAADASRSVRELVRRLFGSDAVAAAKRKLEEVVHLLRAGASSASSALAAALGTCLDVVPICVRKALIALSEFGSCLAERAASIAADAMALVRSIPGVEELLGFSIPTVAKIAITVLSVAVVLYLIFFCPPAGAVAGAMMKAPGGGGLMILRWIFEANPKLYFSILRSAGPAVAAARFVTATCLLCSCIWCVLVFIMNVLLWPRT